MIVICSPPKKWLPKHGWFVYDVCESQSVRRDFASCATKVLPVRTWVTLSGGGGSSCDPKSDLFTMFWGETTANCRKRMGLIWCHSGYSTVIRIYTVLLSPMRAATWLSTPTGGSSQRNKQVNRKVTKWSSTCVFSVLSCVFFRIHNPNHSQCQALNSSEIQSTQSWMASLKNLPVPHGTERLQALCLTTPLNPGLIKRFPRPLRGAVERSKSVAKREYSTTNLAISESPNSMNEP